MTPPGTKAVATNRIARRNYDLLDFLECGMVLRGSEVKSLRTAKVQLSDAYGRIDRGELWLHGLHISPYSHADAHTGHELDRPRKLLAHRIEIERWADRVDQERLTIVPLSLYFKDGRAKVEMALGRGRKQHDKRQALAKRDAEMETRRAMAQRGRQIG